MGVALTSVKLELGAGGSFGQQIIDGDLVGYWPLNELKRLTTVARDISDNANHGTYQGTPTLGAYGGLPEGNCAVRLNGTTDYVQVLDQPDFDVTTFAVVLLLYPEDIGFRCLISRWNADTDDRSWLIDEDDFGRVVVHTSSNGVNSSTFTSAAALTANAWNLVVVNVAGTAIGVSVNDGTPSNGTGLVPFFADAPVLVGKEASASPSTDPFKGRVMQVVLSRVTLSGTDITALYNAMLWTDLSTDFRAQHDASWSRGIPGVGPNDRIAGAGPFEFWLDNRAQKYSPGHASCLNGFDIGKPVRLSLIYGGTTYVQFVGWIDEIDPNPGLYAEAHLTKVIARDFMHSLAEASVFVDSEPLTNVTFDQVIATLVEAMPNQPHGFSAETGISTFPYALDNSREESIKVMEEAHRACRTELGWCFTSANGTLTLHNRHHRALVSTDLATINNTMHGFRAPRRRSDIFARAQVSTHPRRIDDSVVVLYTLHAKSELKPGASLPLLSPYRDPVGQSQRVGGRAMVTPVATTDYTANTLADGTGADMTSSLNVVARFGPSGVRLVLTNTAGVTIFVTKMQVRGKGLYDAETAIGEFVDPAIARTYGIERVLKLDMPYEHAPERGARAAQYLIEVWGLAGVSGMPLLLKANENGTFMTAALTIEPGSRLRVQETVTATDKRGFAHHLAFRLLKDSLLLEVDGTLAPADRTNFWVLGTSVLGSNTTPAYL